MPYNNNWIGGTSGDLSLAENWSLGHIPVLTIEQAVFDTSLTGNIVRAGDSGVCNAAATVIGNTGGDGSIIAFTSGTFNAGLTIHSTGGFPSYGDGGGWGRGNYLTVHGGLTLILGSLCAGFDNMTVTGGATINAQLLCRSSAGSNSVILITGDVVAARAITASFISIVGNLTETTSGGYTHGSVNAAAGTFSVTGNHTVTNTAATGIYKIYCTGGYTCTGDAKFAGTINIGTGTSAFSAGRFSLDGGINWHLGAANVASAVAAQLAADVGNAVASTPTYASDGKLILTAPTMGVITPTAPIYAPAIGDTRLAVKTRGGSGPTGTGTLDITSDNAAALSSAQRAAANIVGPEALVSDPRRW